MYNSNYKFSAVSFLSEIFELKLKFVNLKVNITICFSFLNLVSDYKFYEVGSKRTNIFFFLFSFN